MDEPHGSGTARAGPARLFGVIAEFGDVDDVVAAAAAARAAGYTRVEGYSPFPIEALSHAVSRPRSWLPAIVLAGGIGGGTLAYTFQLWVHTTYNRINVGGRPYHSWPNFIPVTFELTILFAAAAAVIGLLALNGLPRLYHPVFNHHRFTLASQDRFFLTIEARDPLFLTTDVRQFLRSHRAIEVADVEQ
jgi:hypothetical protein